MLDEESCHARSIVRDGEPLLEALEGFRPLKAVAETCPFWPWIHDTLEPTEVGFHLAHASGVEAMAKSDVKTDEIDARMLARLLSVGLVPEVYAKPEEQRDLVRKVRHRKQLVRDRTKLVNRIHGHLHAQGLEIGRERLLREEGRRWLEEEAWAWLSGEQRRVVKSYLRLIDAVTEEIREADRGIREEAKENPAALLLQTIPGIRPFRSLLLAAELTPISRFETPDKLASYTGLAPTHVRLAPGSPLTKYYERQKERIGWAKARVATARKLALLVAFGMVVGCTEEEREVIPEGLELRQELAVGEVDGEPHHLFGQITDVRAGPGDTFVLLDEQGRSVWWMDLTGEPVASLTERGSGPGELERPRALDVSESGRVTVFDPGRGHYGVYDVTSGVFQFTGSFEAVGQEAALGRHMCSVADRLYLRSVDDGDLIQEIDPNGDIVRSFGTVEPASPETFGPAAPMVETIRNSGHLSCFADLGIVVSVGRYLPHVRAFSLEGEQVWEVELTDLRLIGFGPGVGVNYVVDGESGSHLGESLVRWDDETLVVQYSVSWPDSVRAQDRGRDHFAVDSRLIDIRSGREIARTDQLPFIVDSRSDRFFGFRNLPFPQVLMFRRTPA